MRFTVGSEHEEVLLKQRHGVPGGFRQRREMAILMVNGSRWRGIVSRGAKNGATQSGSGRFVDVTKKARMVIGGGGSAVCAEMWITVASRSYVIYWGQNVISQRGDPHMRMYKACGISGPSKEWSSGGTFLTTI